ncbi:hypothetical protein BCR43DRAFT_563071 [Syncephalastrum racemosum]|uniref:BAR domain-domain-containing protein n=1 Tax=Syncephalastrum racemosum TaxID=13706 RepID=A0A1X2HFH2_SYNRA|nr:hypothetical protein BCR43DRAFT_563071 [Syncephalastrum racemosum]
MIKNLGKFRQWTGERLGAAKATLHTEDFQRLEQDTERKRTGFEKVQQATELFYGQLSKKKPSPEDPKAKVSPASAVGTCWISHSSVFGDDSLLGSALMSYGQAESRIAMLQEDYLNAVKEDYMETLERGMQEYREYLNLRKKLESRRLDYDAKLSKLQKAKKEKPELEQEMQASKMKYEETEYDLIQKMMYLQDFEYEHFESLRRLLDAQHAYYSSAVELLDGVRSSWSHGAPAAGPRSAGPPVYHTPTPPIASSIPNDSMTFGAGANVDDGSSIGNYGGAVRTPPPPPPTSMNRRLSTRQGSSDSLNLARRVSTRQASTDSNASSLQHPQQRAPRRVPSAASIHSTGSTSTAATNPIGVAAVATATAAARRPPSPPARRKRRALYDFAGESADELTFTAGSMITVLEEVDEGWWLGELDGQRGIFPVNYTENVSPPMPARPNTTMTTPPAVAPTALMEHPEEDEAADSPFHDEYATPTRLASPPAPPVANHYQQAVPVHTKPSISSSSRTPPPAPSQQYHHQPSSVSTPLSISSRSTPASTPQAVRTPAVDYFASHTQPEGASNAPPCQECGCVDFSPNVFKKGQCKMCFHAHT